MPNPGIRPNKGKTMTSHERVKRSRRRKQIFHQAAQSYDMTPITIYLTNAIISMMERLKCEDANGVNNTDTIAFAALFDWLNSQPESLKAKLGFATDSHAFNPFELALSEAAVQINREGL